MLEDILGQGWEITPAGGATGEAFYAKYQEQTLFLKRNSSPFLAVLSAEGIVPKLVWTRRMENGDTLTAQQWVEGRELSPQEMENERVAKLLKKIHDSEPLLIMLKRLGMKPLDTYQMLAKIESNMEAELLDLPVIRSSIQFLQKELVHIQYDEYVVCHGDIHHNNWLLSNDDELFLIDWDGPLIGDPALDIGMLLYLYISRQKWEQWLTQYGIEMNDYLLLRMKWYVIIQTIIMIKWHKAKDRLSEMDEWIDFLESVIHDK
ncbi:phosphotransferase family protein [Heyndrickxia ginsengihumi]|uniref:Phosphotransferase family protein n=1 Tax=Heyndrickxia ginsengihumi TaxID=363870 RepID=A0A6M0PC03_9BACI|nr:phosphotransferase family protein [Heyndrickxia ginsengihumi]MBE6185035.1 phosphotransferase [Bacillus sp. (in: firmicutes)]MCM3022069.1 phosphotransferase family protein [Heyndrickxia ginsengihumi]NEY20988.1 phosphotransferase family protein [Heyndrickxia ginsengihumi]